MLRGSVVLAIRAGGVKGKAKFTSVLAEPGPRASPRLAVLEAQDGTGVSQTHGAKDHLSIQPPIVQMRKWRLRDGKEVTQSHTASELSG